MRWRHPAVALTAWAGLILGHLVAYALAYPSGSTRHAHLASNGHGWLQAGALLGGVAAALVLAVTVRRSLRAGTAVAPGFLRLAMVQCTAFMAIEVAERGFDIGATFSDAAVLVGLVVQVVVAALTSAALTGVGAAVAGRQRRTKDRFPARVVRLSPPRVLPRAPRTIFLLAAPHRGPPFPATA